MDLDCSNLSKFVLRATSLSLSLNDAHLPSARYWCPSAAFLRCWRPAAAAKSLQLCPTLCDPRDGSPPGSPVPGILQARTLEWVAIAFSWRPATPPNYMRLILWDQMTFLVCALLPLFNVQHNDLFKKDYLFIFGCAGSLLLCGLFSSCAEWGLL